MRLENYLNEKYWKRIHAPDGTTSEVFVNPSWKELMEISDRGGDEIRFSAYHNKKKVYVWNANETLHQYVEDETGEPEMEENENLIAGIAEKKGNTFVVLISDQLKFLLDDDQQYFVREILSKDWSWLRKYKIDISKLIKEYKRKI